MSGEIYMAAAGALAYEKRLQIISNNLANTNTVGFKQDSGNFRLLDPAELADQLPGVSAEEPLSQDDLFWSQFQVYTDYTGGSLKSTGNNFDVALVGDGFFCVQSPDGIRYTRQGDFTLDSQGVLVTRNGWPVMGESGAITVDASSNPQVTKRFSVDEEGYVSVDGSQVDRLRIVDFPQPYALEKVGDTLFESMAAPGAERPAEGVRVSQGSIEMSNVDAVKMMTEMIEVLRGYESYQKVIRSVDEVNSQAINEIGKMA